MQRVIIAVPLVGLCLLGPASAGSPTYEVTIAAEGHDRKDVPVRIPIPRGQAAAAILTGPDGKTIPAQLTGPNLLAPKGAGSEIHFVLPQLKAGESLRLKANADVRRAPWRCVRMARSRRRRHRASLRPAARVALPLSGLR
jgi:hypothetical protein